MKTFLVITSIFNPTDAVKQFSQINSMQTIVVGDKKSPQNYHCDNVIFLSAQKTLSYSIEKLLRYNHYCRKMLGYIYSSKQDAEIIIDTDDDNAPKNNWGFPQFDGTFDLTQKQTDITFLNVYKYYTEKHIWPRGFYLKDILNPTSMINKNTITRQNIKVGVWQGLVDGEPDVDAIYRLTDNEHCYFNQNISPIVLNENCYCPFNSQNTAFRKELFPLLYIPATVTFRFCDILRGLIAQPIMNIAGYKLGFTTSTVVQERNEHDYLKDFHSEIPCYLETKKVIEIALQAIKSNYSIKDNLQEVYIALFNNNIVEKTELKILDAWLKDI